MTAQLVQSPKPRAAKIIHNLTWEQFEELDRSLEDFAAINLFCRYITYHDQYDAVKEFRQAIRD